jgi:hypothetical protein
MFNTPSPDVSMLARKDPGVPPDLQVLLAKQQVDKALQALQSAQAMVQGQQGQGMPTVSELLGQQVQQQVQQLSQPAPMPQQKVTLQKAQGLAQLAQQQQGPQAAPQQAAQPQQLPRQPTQMARGGIVHLPSNLPGSYAGGGIVAFSGGDEVPMFADPSVMRGISAGTQETPSTDGQSLWDRGVQYLSDKQKAVAQYMAQRDAAMGVGRAGAAPALSPEDAAAVNAAMTPQPIPAQAASPPVAQPTTAPAPQRAASSDERQMATEVNTPMGTDPDAIRKEIASIVQDINDGKYGPKQIVFAKEYISHLQQQLAAGINAPAADPVAAVDAVRQQQAPTPQEAALAARRELQTKQLAQLYEQQQKAIGTDSQAAQDAAEKHYQDLVGNRVDSGVAEQRQGLAGLQAAYAAATKPVSHLNIFGVDTGLPQVPADIHARAGFAGAISSMKTNEYNTNLAKQQQAIKGAEAYQTALQELVRQNVVGGTGAQTAGQSARTAAMGLQEKGLASATQMQEWLDRSLSGQERGVDVANINAQARADAAAGRTADTAAKAQERADAAATKAQERGDMLSNLQINQATVNARARAKGVADAESKKMENTMPDSTFNRDAFEDGLFAKYLNADPRYAAALTKLGLTQDSAPAPAADPNAALLAAAQAEKARRQQGK